MDDQSPPSWLELESTKDLTEVERITSLSRETLARRYGHLIVRLSPRRRGMRLRDALAIANGTAQ